MINGMKNFSLSCERLESRQDGDIRKVLTLFREGHLTVKEASEKIVCFTRPEISLN